MNNSIPQRNYATRNVLRAGYSPCMPVHAATKVYFGLFFHSQKISLGNFKLFYRVLDCVCDFNKQ